LKFGEQKRVFSMIPSLKNADFLKYGVMHRNSYLNSPKVLNKDLSLKKFPNVFIAGQLSGVEGYMESASMGIAVALSILKRIKGETLNLPQDTMMGALLSYITNPANADNFQPMNSNYGIIKELENKTKDKKENKQKIYERSMASIKRLKEEN